MAGKQTEVETVKMNDGRLVDFAGKRKLLKEGAVAADGTVTVQLDWRNGETRLFTIPPALMGKFAAHGAEQKLGDQIAGLKGEGGAEADIDDCVLTVDELIDQLYAGEWSTRRESNGLAGTSVLIQALVRLYDGAKTVEQIRTFLKPKTQAEKMALRNSARVRPIVDQIEAEKLAKAEGSGKVVDTDALLDELDD